MRHSANRLATALAGVLGGAAGSGIILIVVAIAAMLVANSPLVHAYESLFHGDLAWSPIAKLKSVHLWINEALMAVFFYVVGLELKRETIDGPLSDARKRRLPVIAAVAGMAVPAVCYLAVAGTAMPLQRGWAIPAATDIAFAMGIVGLLGSRVPASLRLFLLTVAIVDDLGAVMIIALFYTASIKLGWLIAALVVFAGLIAMNRARVTRVWPFVLLSFVLWYCVLHSGVHATIAGVAAALTLPLRAERDGHSLLLRVEHALVPWNSYLVVPLFGFANAGVPLGGGGASEHGMALPLGIAAGLFVGKQVGILGAIFGADRLGIAPRPEGANWMQVWGVTVLCGVGFTMSLFIGALAFDAYPALYEQAKLGVLGGSMLSALLGFALLRFARQQPTAG